jgi:iron complex transport system permease protein
VTPETDSMPSAAGHSGRGAARARWLAWALLALAALGLLVGASVGSTGLGSVFNARHDPVAWQIVMDIRLPRTLGAWLAGALLGLAGAVSQGLFRNPLADPYLLGSASGAALAVALTLPARAPPDWCRRAAARRWRRRPRPGWRASGSPARPSSVLWAACC